MKVREPIGTTVGTMVKVTTDGDQHQGVVNAATEVWQRGGGGRVCDGEGVETHVPEPMNAGVFCAERALRSVCALRCSLCGGLELTVKRHVVAQRKEAC